MRIQSFLVTASLLIALAPLTHATQADDTTITIVSQIAGATPLISQLTLSASSTAVISSVDFSVAPKPGSVTRAFSQNYSASYLASRDYLQPETGDIFLPVYGLYPNYPNSVTLTYHFWDGSTKDDTTTITTTAIIDPCGISTPTALQPRTSATDLSYDFIFVRGACGDSTSGISPVIIDTDGAVRWINPFPADPILTSGTAFFNHAVYLTKGSVLYRVDLDGTVTTLHDYADLGVVNFHHEIDPGKTGMVLDIDTAAYYESNNVEVDTDGNVIKTWSFPDIISQAMIAGGDDPDQFVYPAPGDWFHNNSTTYRKSDNSFISSAREDFVIALDYDTDEIKWILGDTTKKWFQFPSLAQYALTLGGDTLPPIGQHSVGITADDSLLLMDNGRNSLFLMPAGANRTYSTPRKYQLDLTNNVATEVFNYTRNESIYSQFCGSTYEDAPSNYLVDYAYITTTTPITAQIFGLNAAGDLIFDYEYTTGVCTTAYNSTPLHAESLSLTTSGQALNISTRGSVKAADAGLVAGFIITGSESKDVVLRGIGPSLTDAGVSGALSNPTLTLYDSTGAVVVTNDDWANSSTADEVQALGLAPGNAAEAAVVQRLAPGTYTVAVTGKDGGDGIGLVEVYDLSRNSNSNLANLSTRSFVGSGDDVLISGFIVGSRNDARFAIRALGPSLADFGFSDGLADPVLTIYNSDGDVVASNDNWQSDPGAGTLQLVGLAPTDASEAATVANLTPGTYTAVVSGADGSTGVSLVEVYNLP